MIRIGIVGAENSHSAAIAKTINVDKAVPGFAVVAIWGETDEFARKAAEAGQIPTIVKRPAEMIGQIDAVVVDHRHARFHLPAARPFLKARLPMFIDKPFCYRLAEGKAFLAAARRAGVPVTSYSSVPTQAHFGQLLDSARKLGPVRSAATTGPADLKSQWGGIFFYGIHQVDMLVEALGEDVTAVGVAKRRLGGKLNAVASLFWKGGQVASMHCLTEGSTGFQLSVNTDGGVIAGKVANDANPYLTSTRRFCQMFAGGKEPLPHRRILAPVAILEAMERSVRSGKLEKVARF
jgi:predicted dehydrogenase